MAGASTFRHVELPDEVAVQVVAGHSEAISHAYSLMSQAVMNLAYRMLGDRQLAEEVLQDTFVDLLEKSAQIREAGAIKGWVRTVAVNHCLMKLRSPWHARRNTDAADEEVFHHADLTVQMGEMTSSAVMQSAMAALQPDSRVVLWLHEVEGYTHKEIGQLMGKTSSFSKSQLARAYDKLLGWRNSLERKDSLERNNSLERQQPNAVSNKQENVVNLAKCT